MSFEAIGDAIRTRFNTLIEVAESVAVQYDAQADFIPPGNAAYVRLSINYGASQQVEIGGVGQNRYRDGGLVTASVFAVPGEGDEAAMQLVDKIVDAFRGHSAGGVTYRTPQVNVIGSAQVADRHQVDVDVPFYKDTIE